MDAPSDNLNLAMWICKLKEDCYALKVMLRQFTFAFIVSIYKFKMTCFCFWRMTFLSGQCSGPWPVKISGRGCLYLSGSSQNKGIKSTKHIPTTVTWTLSLPGTTSEGKMKFKLSIVNSGLSDKSKKTACEWNCSNPSAYKTNKDQMRL